MLTGHHINAGFPPRIRDLNQVEFYDEAEKTQHESALQALIADFPDQENQVCELYLRKLEDYLPEATIRTFVSIFVVREIRIALEKPATSLH